MAGRGWAAPARWAARRLPLPRPPARLGASQLVSSALVLEQEELVEGLTSCSFSLGRTIRAPRQQ